MHKNLATLTLTTFKVALCNLLERFIKLSIVILIEKFMVILLINLIKAELGNEFHKSFKKNKIIHKFHEIS